MFKNKSLSVSFVLLKIMYFKPLHKFLFTCNSMGLIEMFCSRYIHPHGLITIAWFLPRFLPIGEFFLPFCYSVIWLL